MSTTISRNELKALLESGAGLVLLDVVPEEYYRAGHVPGARNACVYEVDFLDQVAKAVPETSASIVVYGSSMHSLASATAAEKLERAGYARVQDYRGGLEDWECAGLPVERDQPPPAKPKPKEGRHEIDIEKSKVIWTGRNAHGEHSGTARLKEGWLDVASEAASGEFTLDMDSLENTDLSDSGMKRVLIAHLKSDDFFDTARFPISTFHLRHVTLNPHARPGSVNADIHGALTLKGVTEDLAFPAIIEALPDGGLSAEAHLDIDRTRWNVIYGSGKFYEWLGKHLVHDCVSMEIHLFTKPVG